jgi:tetratricopeptide (TPR) repeat protein
MSGRTLPSTGRETVENELLAQLGLPPSATPEDVDDLHLAVSEYLAAAPAGIRGWAHAQAAALDRTYLTLTDPVGLQGSALRSPDAPSAVAPGGPVTPPARRDSAPAAVAVAAVATTDETPEAIDAIEATTDDEPDLSDLDALYASVTPSAHEDMRPDPKRSASPRAAATAAAPAKAKTSKVPKAQPVAAAAAPNPWKRVALGTIGLVAVVGILVGGYAIGGSGDTATAAGPTAAPTTAAPAIDQAKVSDLMAALQANADDVTTLMALANEFYAGGLYDEAGGWLDQVLAIEPEHIQALLAKGAIAFNTGDTATAETSWQQVVEIDPKNVEAHYDLGFLYLNSATPDWAGVQREWQEVIRLDPDSDLAKTVGAHLASLEAASMLPTASGEPAASPAASSAASDAPAAAPAASPAASTAP